MEKISDDNPLRELLDELISSLERLEARSDAIHQFLIGKRKVTEKSLAPYTEQAANASEVRWRAFRVRAEALLAAGTRELEKNANSEKAKAEQSGAEEAKKPGSGSDESAKSQGERKPGEDKGQTDRQAQAAESKQEPKVKAASAPETKQKGANASEGKPEEANARSAASVDGEARADENKKDQPETKAPAKSAA